jgi:hypothetical protein
VAIKQLWPFHPLLPAVLLLPGAGPLSSPLLLLLLPGGGRQCSSLTAAMPRGTPSNIFTRPTRLPGEMSHHNYHQQAAVQQQYSSRSK